MDSIIHLDFTVEDWPQFTKYFREQGDYLKTVEKMPSPNVINSSKEVKCSNNALFLRTL